MPSASAGKPPHKTCAALLKSIFAPTAPTKTANLRSFLFPVRLTDVGVRKEPPRLGLDLCDVYQFSYTM